MNDKELLKREEHGQTTFELFRLDYTFWNSKGEQSRYELIETDSFYGSETVTYPDLRDVRKALKTSLFETFEPRGGAAE